MARFANRPLRPVWAALALLLVGSGTTLSVAHACGAFRARTVSPEQRPSLAREKVVLIYDAEAQREHFIREIAFDRSDAAFGFVVPTPGLPEVESVDAPNLFSVLRDHFPFQLRFGTLGARGGGSSSSGFGKGAPAGVRVIEEKRVGSFQAFVLRATRRDALAQWLDTNDFVTTEASDAWLEHYVAMRFDFVAMRYDPPKTRSASAGESAPPTVAAETIRISFDTPLPYYPYLEPAEARAGEDPRRLLEVWYVGTRPVVPVATHIPTKAGQDARPTWVRPLREGDEGTTEPDALAQQLPRTFEPLLPSGKLVVQTFQDQKTVRAGFGDVLFVPRDKQEIPLARQAAFERLLPLIDPAISPPSLNSKRIDP